MSDELELAKAKASFELRFNHNHDSKGRFSSGAGAAAPRGSRTDRPKPLKSMTIKELESEEQRLRDKRYKAFSDNGFERNEETDKLDRQIDVVFEEKQRRFVMHGESMPLPEDMSREDAVNYAKVTSFMDISYKEIGMESPLTVADHQYLAEVIQHHGLKPEEYIQKKKKS